MNRILYSLKFVTEFLLKSCGQSGWQFHHNESSGETLRANQQLIKVVGKKNLLRIGINELQVASTLVINTNVSNGCLIMADSHNHFKSFI